MNIPTTKNTQPPAMWYIPGSSEKKKCIMMYMWLGIVLSLSRDSVSVFEYFHLKQSIGRWMAFIMMFLVVVVLMFLPIIWFLWWIIVVLMLILCAIFAKQARDWLYFDPIDKAVLPLFVWVGWWILQMFEFQIHIIGDDKISQNDTMSSEK
jgi:uncharacterized membrane protein